MKKVMCGNEMDTKCEFYALLPSPRKFRLILKHHQSTR